MLIQSGHGRALPSDFWMTSRVKTARSAANFLRSFLGWHPFWGRVFQYNQDQVLSFFPNWLRHLGMIFHKETQHEMLSIFMNFYLRWGGSTALFGAKFFLTIRTKCCRIFWLNFSLEENFWTKKIRTRCCQNGCPFLVRLFEKEETLWILRAEFFQEWEDRLPLFGAELLLKSIKTCNPFFGLSFFTTRNNRSGISCKIVRKCCPFLDRFFRMNGKTVHFLGWTS